METITRKSLDQRARTSTTFVVFDMAAELERMHEGEVLEVITDEFEPFDRDIAAWCGATGHVLVGSEPMAKGHRFLVEKRPRNAMDTSHAMVISSAGLEEPFPPLGFALAAALEGMDVHLYFQGPAVRVLTRGFRPG